MSGAVKENWKNLQYEIRIPQRIYIIGIGDPGSGYIHFHFSVLRGSRKRGSRRGPGGPAGVPEAVIFQFCKYLLSGYN